MQLKKKLILVPTEGMTRAEWLEERRKTIGGSDAAAIIGQNPYATPYTVWADKTGRLPDKPDNEAMRQGRDLEQYVADRFTEVSGKKTRHIRSIIKNPDYPFAAANIDRSVVKELSGLECKTTSVLNLKRFKGEEFPMNYYCQCVHYLAITEFERWYLAVLVLNQGFMVYQITRIENDPVPEWCTASVYVPDDEIASLMAAERDFWAFVESDTPPPLSGTKPDSDALAAIYRGCDEETTTINLFGRGKMLERYFELKAQADELEVEMNTIKQTIQADLGDCECGVTDGYGVTWKSQTRSTFDHKALIRDHPELDCSAYFKLSRFRKFDIKVS